MQTKTLSREIAPNICSVLSDTGNAPYDSRAGFYEALVSTRWFNRLFWGTTPDDYRKFAAKAIANTQGSLLDVGCGGLAQTANLYRSTRKNCVLVDRSLEMLKIARSKLVNQNKNLPDHIQFLQADAFQLPFFDQSFDTVCSYGTIHLFDRPQKQEFINELLRVLRPGGRFYFLSMTDDQKIGKIFMKFTKMTIDTFGTIFSSKDTQSLFSSNSIEVVSYTIGSVIFISGKKKQP